MRVATLYSRRPFIPTRREPLKSPNNRESEKKDSPEKSTFIGPAAGKNLLVRVCTHVRLRATKSACISANVWPPLRVGNSTATAYAKSAFDGCGVGGASSRQSLSTCAGSSS